MSIKIKRNTGWQGSGSNIKIIVNGEEVASVPENQQVEVELPHDQAHLKVSQLGISSGEIEVKDGDRLEVIPTRWYRMNFPIFIAMLVLSIFIPGLYRLITIFSLSLILVISLYLTDGFQLKVLERDRH